MAHLYAGATAGIAGALQGMQEDPDLTYACLVLECLVLCSRLPNHARESRARAAQKVSRTRRVPVVRALRLIWSVSVEVLMQSGAMEQWAGSLENISLGKLFNNCIWEVVWPISV